MLRDVELFQHLLLSDSGMTDVVAIRCAIKPVSFWKCEVLSADKPVSLHSVLFQDMEAMREDVDPLTEARQDMHDLLEERQPRGGPPAVEVAEEDALEAVKDVLQSIHATTAVADLECEGLEQLDVGSGSDYSDEDAEDLGDLGAEDAEDLGGFAAGRRGRGRGRRGQGRACRGAGRGHHDAEPLCPVPEDESLDRFIIPVRAIYHVVDKEGRKVGEIHPRFQCPLPTQRAQGAMQSHQKLESRPGAYAGA